MNVDSSQLIVQISGFVLRLVLYDERRVRRFDHLAPEARLGTHPVAPGDAHRNANVDDVVVHLADDALRLAHHRRLRDASISGLPPGNRGLAEEKAGKGAYA